MKRLLMVAYHFPPLAGSSGIQRTLRFVQHLPQFGWQPLVLSAHPRAYERCTADLDAEVPPGTVVRRAFALDSARHLSLRGRYIAATARPDRWVSWKFAAVREGLRMIREFRPQALWSTYPIATAHLIGAELQRRSGLPWLADFRDPMAQEGYPADPLTWRAFADIEADALRRASASVFTTPGAARVYRERYPEAAERVHVLENGYDEESFVDAERDAAGAAPLQPAPRVTLLHSGIVYPAERDPTQLFVALGRLKASGTLGAQDVCLRFRAAVHDGLLTALAREHGVEDLIEVVPAIGYRAALAEMLRADALLALQASNCNEQIPAKIYEYLRAGRPILCLSDPHGDTAQALLGHSAQAPLDSPEAIAAALPRFVEDVRRRQAPLPQPQAVLASSRRERTRVLAELLESVTATEPVARTGAAMPA